MTGLRETALTVGSRHFRPELAQDIYQRARDIPFLGIPTACFVTFLFFTADHAPFLIAWNLAFIAIYLSAYHVLFRKSREPDNLNYVRWSTRFVLFFGAFAVMWTIFAFLSLPVLGEWQKLSLLMILFGIVALPAPVFSMCLPIAVFHPATILLPSISIYLLSHDGFDKHMLAGVILLAGGIAFILKQIATTQRIIRSVDDKRALSSSLFTIEKMNREKDLDPITGLLNSDGLRARIATMNHASLAVFAVKVEGIEDIYSIHSKGIADTTVWTIAQRLISHKKPETVLAHAGLGEFFMVTATFKTKDLEEPANRIFELFAQPFLTDLGQVSFKISVGAAQYEQQSGLEEQAINNALTAMREATLQLGNAFQAYNESLGNKISQQFSIRSQLHQAIENNEFVLHLQPKVTIDNGEIASAEALVRWNSPELGMVSPAEFIPIAESTGDIILLGRWVLQEAVRLLQSPSLPDTFSIAVNISAKQFSDTALLSQLAQIKKQLKNSKRSIELEITESMIMADSSELNHMLKKIKAMGFHLALDDFGTGYSSLSYLTQLKADTLKLDKSFIDPIPGDRKHAAFVASIIHMVQALDLKLVAEGIESHEQLAWLADRKCDTAQGFYFSKPLAFEDFLARFATNPAEQFLPAEPGRTQPLQT